MIYTSSYKNCNTDKYNIYSISGDRGKRVGYVGNYYSALAPKKDFWQTWHDNIGILSYDEILHYQKIIKALVLTNDIMQQIDETINV